MMFGYIAAISLSNFPIRVVFLMNQMEIHAAMPFD